MQLFASNVLTLTKNNDPDSTVKVPVPFVEADAATGYTPKRLTQMAPSRLYTDS